MRFVRSKKFRVIGSAVLAFALVVLPVAGVQADEMMQARSVVTVAPAADPVPFTPSGSGLRKYMLNMLSSVLGKVTPSGWRAEQIANQYQYNFGWDELAARTGIKSDAPAGQLITTDWATKPQTKADYDLLRMEQSLTGAKSSQGSTTTTTNKRGIPLRVPATVAKPLGKLVNGAATAATALTGFSLGTMIGGGLVSMFGFDAEGAVCSETPDNAFGSLVGMIAGQDCNAWRIAEEFAANSTVTPGFSAVVCNPANAAQCITYKLTFNLGGGYYGYCASSNYISGNAQYPLEIVLKNGTTPATLQFKTESGSNFAPCSGIYSSYYTKGNVDNAGGVAGWKWPRVNGSPVPPTVPITSTSGNPSRNLVCTIEGDNGATYTQTSESYTQTDDQMATPECPALPDGVMPTNVKIDETGGGETNTLQNEAVTDEYKNWWSAFPECRTGACKLDLITNTSPASCFDLAEQCADWFSQSNKADLYQCRYGQNDVALSECNVYEGVFKPGRVLVGAPYSDPMTGSWSGGANVPKPDTQALGQAVQNPAGSRACNGLQADGFDPVAFVMRPVQCALEWAFVPRAAVIELEGANLVTGLNTRAPGQLIGMASGWNFNAQFTGCRRTAAYSPANIFSNTSGGETVLWDACPGGAQEVLGNISRVVVSLGLIIMVVLVVKRRVAQTVDYS